MRSPRPWDKLPASVQVPLVLIICFVAVPAIIWFIYYLLVYGLNG